MRERKLNLSIVVVCGILALLSAIGTVTVAFSSELNELYKFEAVCDLISLGLAFFYIVNGYGKDYAKYYKLSMLFHALNALIVTAVAANEKTKYISIVMCAICFALVLVLALGKDLGAKKSLTICVIVVVIRAAGLISQYFAVKTFDPITILTVSQLVLALMILASTLAKYDDKQVRGTK